LPTGVVTGPLSATLLLLMLSKTEGPILRLESGFNKVVFEIIKIILIDLKVKS
jgi:hypothetical protein